MRSACIALSPSYFSLIATFLLLFSKTEGRALLKTMSEFSLARTGYCQTTITGRAGNCLSGKKGTVRLPFVNQTSWQAAFSYCVERCASCERCRYISVSINWEDCSWFYTCNMDALRNEPKGFKSAALQKRKSVAGPAVLQKRNSVAGVDTLAKYPTERGYCATTDANAPGDCTADDKGLIDVVAHQIHNLAACIHHCKTQCSRCNFVSWARLNEDTNECSWYHRCPRLHWLYGGQFVTVKVRAEPRDAAALALPPPPPPAQLAPSGSNPGYCSLMDPSLGSCDADDQGSWAETLSAEQCVARCAGCANCNYVSVSLAAQNDASNPFREETPRTSTTSAVPGATPARRVPTSTHAPYWWRCRWYRACDLADLRQTGDAGGYVTLAVKGSLGSLAAAVAITPPQTTHAAEDKGTEGKGTEARTPQLSRAPASAGPRALPQLGVVTVAARGGARVKFGYDVRCALTQWCLSVMRLEAALPAWRVRRLVIVALGQSTAWLNSSAGCALEAFTPAPRLRDAASSCAARVAASSYAHLTSLQRTSGYVHDSAYFKEINMLKWHIFAMHEFEVILFADADLEVVPYAEKPRSLITKVWSSVLARFRASPAKVIADPDSDAPLNTGFMLIKPDAQIFDEGLAVMERCVYNRTVGWDAVGRPSTLRVAPLLLRSSRHRLDYDPSSMARNLEQRLQATKAYRTDSWDFTSSDCDQGLFFYILYVKHRLGAFGRAWPIRRSVRLFGRHWWASYKPWRAYPLDDAGTLYTQAEMASRIRKEDPSNVADLARIYAYVVRLEAPATLSVPDTALLRSSECWQSQYNLRRAIESQYSHFWEVEALRRASDGARVVDGV
jgi:hypothetical protein